MLKAKEGDDLCVGLEGGKIGVGIIKSLTASSLTMDVKLEQKPPDPSLVTLILALPRPIVLKRLLLNIVTLGVKKIVLLNTYRVEKTYWKSKALEKDKIREQLILGLEQAKDTIMPEVIFKKRFKPFVEDELTGLIKGKTAVIAHPGLKPVKFKDINREVILVIGPEGGFIPYEIEKFVDVGFKCIDLGERILKVETAVPFAISKIG